MTDRNEPKRFSVYADTVFRQLFQWRSECFVGKELQSGALMEWRSLLIGCLAPVLLSSVWTPLSAQGASGNGCELPSGTMAPRIKIDATAQGVKNSELSYLHAKRVEILIYNMNPYKYRYSISDRQNTEISIDPGKIRGVLGNVLRLMDNEFNTNGDPSQPKPTNRQKLRTIENTIANYSDLVNEFQILIAADRVNCEVLRLKSEQILAEMPAGKIREWKSYLKNPAGGYINEIKTAIKKAEEATKKTKDLLTRIRQIKSLERPFSYLYSIDKGDGITNSVIEIYRVKINGNPKSIEEDSRELIASLRIRMGSAPASLSVGVGFSTADSSTIARQASCPRNSESKTCMVTPQFGYTSQSTFKPTGIVLLNGHAVSRSKFTFGPSVGLSFGERNSSAQLDYLIGASLGLRNNLLWFTGGLHATRVERLSGGFKIGDVVPPELQDPLPTTSGFKAGFMFAVSFRIK